MRLIRAQSSLDKPMGRLGEPGEMLAGLIFSSDESSYTTGQIHVIEVVGPI